MSLFRSNEDLYLIELGMEDLIESEEVVINLEEKPALTDNHY